MIMKQNRKGQGLLEYIVILAAVLTAIIAFAGSGLRTTMRNEVLDRSANTLDRAIKNINLSGN